MSEGSNSHWLVMVGIDIKLIFSLFNWWFSVTHTVIHVSCLDIIFGIHNPECDDIIQAYNYCILFAKKFIYDMKLNMKDCDFYEYQIELKNRLEVEALLSTENGTNESFHRRWSDIINGL